MIESFFQSLRREGVDYLLISGQATVLYGAAVFSEDIDLWVKPAADNVNAFRDALASVRATYYKLTPPLEVSYMLRGHGFHFRVPDAPDVYLDVMGQPPRVPAFDEVTASAAVMPTAWGDIPTIGIKHLAALKTTQRLGDYPVISQLVLRYMESTDDPGVEDYRWAIDNLHTIDELEAFLRAFPDAVGVCETEAPALARLAREACADAEIHDATRLNVERWLGERILFHMQADRNYWRAVIAELREMRSAGKLTRPSLPVESADSA